MSEAYKLVQEQAEDEGLWFKAKTASEFLAQHDLKHIHSCFLLRRRGYKNAIPFNLPTEDIIPNTAPEAYVLQETKKLLLIINKGSG